MKAREDQNWFPDDSELLAGEPWDNLFDDDSSDDVEQNVSSGEKLAGLLHAYMLTGTDPPEAIETNAEQVSDASKLTRYDAALFNRFASVHKSVDLDIAVKVLEGIGTSLT